VAARGSGEEKVIAQSKKITAQVILVQPSPAPAAGLGGGRKGRGNVLDGFSPSHHNINHRLSAAASSPSSYLMREGKGKPISATPQNNRTITPVITAQSPSPPG